MVQHNSLVYDTIVPAEQPPGGAPSHRPHRGRPATHTGRGRGRPGRLGMPGEGIMFLQVNSLDFRF